MAATKVKGDWGERRGKQIEKDVPTDQGLKKKRKPKLKTIRNKNGKTVETLEEITKRWAEYCHGLF